MARASAVAKKILATRTHQLPVYLTEPEIREAGKRLAHLEGELAAHGAREKDVKDDLKSKRSALESQVHALAGTIRQGYEYRPVPVRVEADYRAGKVFEIREDTGEVVAERAVNEQDKQVSIFDAAPAPAEKCGACGLPSDAPNSACDECDHGRTRTAEQRKEAERAKLERDADAILANASDGKLNAKGLKGAAVASKKGGRR